MGTAIERYNEADAIDFIDKAYGSLEDFAIALIEDEGSILNDPDIGMQAAASALGIPAPMLAKLLGSSHFHSILDKAAALATYGFRERITTMQNLVDIANTPTRRVLTRSGKVEEVDREAKEMIDADEHLRKLQDRPLEQKSGGGSAGIQIFFGGGEGEQRVRITQAGKSSDEAVEASFRPKRAGDLPPPGARPLYGVHDDERQLPLPGTGSDFDFTGDAEAEAPRTGSLATALEHAKPQLTTGELKAKEAREHADRPSDHE